MQNDRIGLDLQRRAHERILSGRLPGGNDCRTWGGRGRNLPCALCDISIVNDEVEYEVETSDASGVRQYHFHILCHDVWQQACSLAN
jgi:hypothetical protein